MTQIANKKLQLEISQHGLKKAKIAAKEKAKKIAKVAKKNTGNAGKTMVVNDKSNA